MSDQQNTGAQLPPQGEISVTLKIPGKDRPWIVVRGSDAAVLEDKMRQLQHGGLFAQVGRAQAILEANFRHHFGNVGQVAPAEAANPEVAPTQEIAEAAYNVGNILGGSAISPQPGDAQTAALNEYAAHEQGGPTPAQPPQQPAPQPHQQRPEPSAMQQPLQTQPAAQQPQPGGPAMAPQAMAQPQPQQPTGQFAPPPQMPGAPMVLGQPARFHSGVGARGPWQAFFDPRSQEELAKIPVGADGKVPETNDPNHPGLASGTHKFVSWLR